MAKSFILLLCLLQFNASTKVQDIYFPPLIGNNWETISPTSLNWCDDDIEALYDFLEVEQTKSFILLKDGKIVLEQYFGDFGQDSLWIWYSAGKSLRATLVGIAQAEGLVNIEDSSADYLGQGWSSLSPEKEALITIRHQLTMTSGLDETEFSCITPNCLTYVADAGTRWAYHNGSYNLLKPILEKVSGQTLNQYTNTRIRNTIGMWSGFWLDVGNNSFFVSRARDMARFGLLIANQGVWKETTILKDSAFYDQMVNTSQNLNPSYGYLWWLNGKEGYIPPGSTDFIEGPIAPDAPSDVFLAAGSQGQFIGISPDNGWVMIRQGNYTTNSLAALDLHNQIWKRIMSLECMPTAIEETSMNSIQVFPNPSKDVLHIQLPFNSTDTIVRLYDLNGNNILETTANEKNYTLNVSYLNGIYFLEVVSGEMFWVEKVMME